MNDIAETRTLAFEDAPVPNGVEFKPIDPAIIPIEAYTPQAYAQLENERLWGKVWQAACRIEEMPDVGDYVTYEIMDESIIVVRSAPDKIEAYYNVCQHRGRRLTEGCGHTSQFTCKFHGWRWKLNGETAFINDRKGYDDCLTPENTRLAAVKVDTWGGWVWINMDPDCEPLRDYLEPIATYLDQYQLDRMRYRWRQWLVFPCNWKTALEAFNESHHAAITHPQLCEWGSPAFYWCRAEGRHAWHGPASSGGPGGEAGTQSAVAMNSREGGAAYDPRIAMAQSLRATMEGVNACTTQTMIEAADSLTQSLSEGTPVEEVLAHFTRVAQGIDRARGVDWPMASASSNFRSRFAICSSW